MKRRTRASVVCEAEGHLLLVRLRDPTTGVESWFPPGGGVEEDERPAETARRETLEETGVAVHVQSHLVLVDRYPFRWDGVDYDCVTHYFAAELEGAFDPDLAPVRDAPYHRGAKWLPSAEGLAELAVNPRIGAAVSRVLGRARRTRWRAQGALEGPAGMLLTLHDHFRVATERLRFMFEREPDVPLGWVGRAFAPIAEMLHHHHHAEEQMLFPFVERRTGSAPEKLVLDHGELTAAIDAVNDALRPETAREDAAAALARFEDVLVDHLDREEGLVVPVLLELAPAEAWALIHA
ncbi:MAG: NUDIX domain-containing protein [Labilithrix sp.]|nr:NUDIX domain-containing protein [Labilithrix sp.]MCW5813192.1 NUDIX domain-containing protein [Labilithrix sp.]